MTGVRRPMSRPDIPAPWTSRPSAPVPDAPRYGAEPAPSRPAPSADLDISAVVNAAVIAERYLIEKKLGEGGMAAVYKATDLVLEEVVALKLFRTASQDAAGAERFKQEMKLCRRLTHPNVVRSFEFGVWGGAYFLTMEFLDGQDLDGVLKDAHGPLPNPRGLDLMIQAADGLQAAHDEGIAHRDVKPQNMFVVGDRLKIMDFGIARAMDGGVSVTQAGMVVGTPAYLSPERLEGNPGDGRSSDLYALGVVMYQVWTGVLPFRGPDITAMFMQHLTEAPEPPSRRNPQTPRAVERVILQLLEKREADRFPTAAAVRDALVAAKAGMRLPGRV
jgi:serine/threonine-protein kinase